MKLHYYLSFFFFFFLKTFQNAVKKLNQNFFIKIYLLLKLEFLLPDHLFFRDGSISVDVKNSENLLQIFFRRPVRHDVENDHELPKVDVAVGVRVVHPEDVLLELVGIGVGKAGINIKLN